MVYGCAVTVTEPGPPIPGQLDFWGHEVKRGEGGAGLTGQLWALYRLMRGGHWVCLDEVSYELGCSTACAGARIRDLRKAKYGGYTVERQLSDGVHWYRLVL